MNLLLDSPQTSSVTTVLPRADVRPAATQANLLLAGMFPAERARLKAKLELRKLHQGDILFTPGVRNTYVYFPEDAVISHVYEGEAGTSVEAAMIGFEGASGLCTVFDEQAPEYRASVTVAGYAYRILASDLREEFARRGTLQIALVRYLAGHVAELGQRVSCGIYHHAEERLCAWLLMLRDRSGRANLRITHDEIASLLGLNRTSVSCIAKRLKDNGSVNYARGKLQICDPAILKKHACECYAILSGSKEHVPAYTL